MKCVDFGIVVGSYLTQLFVPVVTAREEHKEKSKPQTFLCFDPYFFPCFARGKYVFVYVNLNS